MLTNGTWNFRPIARHDGYVWVVPVSRVDPKDSRPFPSDGPLTFLEASLKVGEK